MPSLLIILLNFDYINVLKLDYINWREYGINLNMSRQSLFPTAVACFSCPKKTAKQRVSFRYAAKRPFSTMR